MQISKQDVEHVAKLARLEITESEKEAFSQQLSAILTYMEQLNRLDTTGVEPTATVLPQTNVVRADEILPCLPVDSALANAPERENDFFVVPRILTDR